MRLILSFFLILALSFLHPMAQAEDLDPASTEGLTKTQELLTDPALRETAIKESPDAQIVNNQVTSLAGNSTNTEDIYKLSSAIFSDLIHETGGDPQKLQEILTAAKNDPKSLLKHLSDPNQQLLKQVSTQISTQPTLTHPAGASN